LNLFLMTGVDSRRLAPLQAERGSGETGGQTRRDRRRWLFPEG